MISTIMALNGALSYLRFIFLSALSLSPTVRLMRRTGVRKVCLTCLPQGCISLAGPAHAPSGKELIFQSMSHRILVGSGRVFEDAAEIAFI